MGHFLKGPTTTRVVKRILGVRDGSIFLVEGENVFWPRTSSNEQFEPPVDLWIISIASASACANLQSRRQSMNSKIEKSMVRDGSTAWSGMVPVVLRNGFWGTIPDQAVEPSRTLHFFNSLVTGGFQECQFAYALADAIYVIHKQNGGWNRSNDGVLGQNTLLAMPRLRPEVWNQVFRITIDFSPWYGSQVILFRTTRCYGF